MTTDEVQLVWDRGCCGTAQGQRGRSLRVGPCGDWTSEQLLVAAAESGIMSEFLRLSDQRGLAVLGYVSAAATYDADPPGPPRIVVRPCIVIEREEDRAPALWLIEEAAAVSSIGRALKASLRVEPQAIVVHPAGESD